MSNYTEEEILLNVSDVSKHYGGKLVLRNVNAIIHDIKVPGEIRGQVVGFIGPSGIGKSTLIRIMAGLIEPSSGKVVLDAKIDPVQAGDVGLVAQSYPLLWHRTVMGNLMRAANKSIGLVEHAHDRVIQLLNDFGLGDLARAYPRSLSGGQRQRVAILQQILCSGNNLLMDEPFSGLDPVAKHKVQALIQKVANLDERNSIVIVSHDIAAVCAVADHLWTLGRDIDKDGNFIPGAYIVKTYNLIDMGLAWHEEIQSMPQFTSLVQEISEGFGQL